MRLAALAPVSWLTLPLNVRACSFNTALCLAECNSSRLTSQFASRYSVHACVNVCAVGKCFCLWHSVSSWLRSDCGLWQRNGKESQCRKERKRRQNRPKDLQDTTADRMRNCHVFSECVSYCKMVVTQENCCVWFGKQWNALEMLLECNRLV